MQRYIFPAAAALALLIITAWVQGSISERWTKRPVTAEQKAFAERLDHAPTAVGDWVSVEVPVDDRQLEASRSVGSFSRIFQNKYNPKKIVHLFIVCGHPRDITQHTPDQCYVLNGFAEVEDARKYPVDTGESEGSGKAPVAWFWTNRFRKGATFEGPQHLRIFWTFSKDGNWEAPTIARVEFANAPALYKIYAITEVAGDSHERPEESSAVEFLRDYVPALNAVLFPKEGAEKKSPETAANPAPEAVEPGLK